MYTTRVYDEITKRYGMTDEDAQGTPSTGDLMAAWIKTTTDFWGSMAKTWPSRESSFGPDTDTDTESASRFQQHLASHMKLWDAAAKAMAEPGAMDSVLKGFQTAPDISMRFLQTSVDGMAEFQKRWVDRLIKISGSTEPFSFDDLDSEFLNRWTDTYKKELQKFLNVPQLGLTKFYQEKFNRTLDKHNLFQAALAEFLQLLSVPVEKSFRVMQEKITEVADSGKFPEDSKYYYNMWIKVLEGHFMTLYQSDEYTVTMSKTLDAMNQYLHARQEVMEDMLQSFPVTTHKDMDELYKEIYQLKRRIRTLEKQQRDENP